MTDYDKLNEEWGPEHQTVLEHWSRRQAEPLSSKQFLKPVALAMIDDATRQRLLSNPEEVFNELGLRLPSDRTIKVVEDTATEIYLVLPPPVETWTQEKVDIMDEELKSPSSMAPESRDDYDVMGDISGAGDGRLWGDKTDFGRKDGDTADTKFKDW